MIEGIEGLKRSSFWRENESGSTTLDFTMSFNYFANKCSTKKEKYLMAFKSELITR